MDTEGRVEVFHAGAWGSVCDDSWDGNDAAVVCRFLGIDGGSLGVGRAAYGAADGAIHMDNVDCNGDEASLDLCSHNGWGVHNCVSLEAAGVRCGVPQEELDGQWY